MAISVYVERMTSSLDLGKGSETMKIASSIHYVYHIYLNRTNLTAVKKHLTMHACKNHALMEEVVYPSVS